MSEFTRQHLERRYHFNDIASMISKRKRRRIVRNQRDYGLKPNENLSGVDLSNLDLRGTDFSGANLGGAKLDGANLGDANLSNANLGGANLSGAYLPDANLNSTNLSGAHLAGAFLFGADLSGATMPCLQSLPAGLPLGYTFEPDPDCSEPDRFRIVPE